MTKFIDVLCIIVTLVVLTALMAIGVGVINQAISIATGR